MINKVILLGNLGADPDATTTKSGKVVANFRMATGFKDKVEWHNIVAFDKLATSVAEYLHKGSKVYLEGRIQTRSWEDKDGNKKYMTEVVAHEIKFLDPKGQDGEEVPPAFE